MTIHVQSKLRDDFPDNSSPRECVGNCPNVCKAHMGEFMFCINPGCICHPQKEVAPQVTEWEARFDEKFGHYEWSGGSTTIAEHDFGIKDFIRDLLLKEREETIDFIKSKITERGTYDLNYDDIYDDAALRTDLTN